MEPARVEFAYDYSQLYLYDAETGFGLEANAYLDALDAATATGLTVGASSGVVDVLMPRRENFGASMHIRVASERPSLHNDADHAIEFDLALPSGRLVLEGSGGSGMEELRVPPGNYRARLSGNEFDAAAQWRYEDEGNPADSYLLELWPASEERPPAELRRWPGYALRLG
jgi:hypothetical protein